MRRAKTSLGVWFGYREILPYYFDCHLAAITATHTYQAHVRSPPVASISWTEKRSVHEHEHDKTMLARVTRCSTNIYWHSSDHRTGHTEHKASRRYLHQWACVKPWWWAPHWSTMVHKSKEITSTGFLFRKNPAQYATIPSHRSGVRYTIRRKKLVWVWYSAESLD